MPDDQGRPAGLVAGPQSPARFGVEVFVEKHEVAPVRVRLETPVVRMTGAASLGIWQKEARQSPRNFARGFLEIQPAA
jgi:hypothetical protein